MIADTRCDLPRDLAGEAELPRNLGSMATSSGSMPAVTDGAHTACDGSLARAFDFLGKRWNGVIIGTLMHGPANFSGLRRAIPTISESVLSTRLTELASGDLVSRRVCPGPPVTVVYSLTEHGEALVPVLGELAGWASRHLPASRCDAVEP